MRHRKRGRILGRSPSHRKAMLRNLASSLFLTERDAEFDHNAPTVKGRVVTTLHKAKEVRPLVEKCITVARRSLNAQEEAQQYVTGAERGSESWRAWRGSDEWRKWNSAIAPVVTARRHALRLLGNKQAVKVLFDEIAPRMADRDGGYTRILRLAQPRLGDAGTRAILELVGVRDRVKVASEKPAFEQAPTDETSSVDDTEAKETGEAARVEADEQAASNDDPAGEDVPATSESGADDSDLEEKEKE